MRLPLVVSCSVLLACAAPPPASVRAPVDARATTASSSTVADTPPAHAAPAQHTFEWLASADEARTRAVAEHRPLLLYFWAAWCAACLELDRKTFDDPEVKKRLAPFVAARLDVTDDDDKAMQSTKERYQVVGLPTVLFIDSAGRESTRFTEFVAPEKLMRAADDAASTN